MGMRSFHATYSRTPDASHLAITGPSARLASSSFSHEGWLRNTVCCDGAETRGMTSWPLVIERVTASSVPSSVAHASRASTSAVTRDVGMMGRPSSSRGSAMESGKDSRPPASLRASSSHRVRRRFPHTKAAIMPSTRKSVVSASPSQPRTTRRSALGSRRMRSATGPKATFSGKKHLSSCENCPLLTCEKAAKAVAAGMPCATAGRFHLPLLRVPKLPLLLPIHLHRHSHHAQERRPVSAEESEQSLVGDFKRLARKGFLKGRTSCWSSEPSGHATPVNERSHTGPPPRALSRRSDGASPVTRLRSPPPGICPAAPAAVVDPPAVRRGGAASSPEERPAWSLPASSGKPSFSSLLGLPQGPHAAGTGGRP
mmetsp:Transcript_41415/g.86542  ORF Transcript_41415/g.86542 Transcript_41415/m.86542 type:complete len:371 (+) Transcript_41415:2304-3416(+)